MDITAAMNDRAMAQKRLNENTFDLEAMCMLNRAQEQVCCTFYQCFNQVKKCKCLLFISLLFPTVFKYSISKSSL